MSAGNYQRALVDKSGMMRKSDGDAQLIRSRCGARVALFAHPARIKEYQSCGLYHVVFWLCSNISEEFTASITRTKVMTETEWSSETLAHTLHSAALQKVIDS
jgi:hypothetical protein